MLQNLQGLPFNTQTDAILLCLSCMKEMQQSEGKLLLKVGGLETCSAAANDFLQMSSECTQLLVYDVMFSSRLDHPHVQRALLDLKHQYAADALRAVLELNTHAFQVVEEQVGDLLFSDEWEENAECAIVTQIVSTLRDYVDVISIYLAEESLVKQLIKVMMRSSINFYIKHLLIKAEEKQEKGKKKIEPTVDPWEVDDAQKGGELHPCCFKHGDRAVYFIHADVAVLTDFFDTMTEKYPDLETTIEQEFDVMNCIFGLLLIASSEGDVSTIQLHFRGLMRAVNNNEQACHYLIGDLFHLVAPDRESDACQVFKEHQELHQSMTHDSEQVKRLLGPEDNYGDTHQLETMIVEQIEISQRPRPTNLMERFNQSWRDHLGAWTHLGATHSLAA